MLYPHLERFGAGQLVGGDAGIAAVELGKLVAEKREALENTKRVAIKRYIQALQDKLTKREEIKTND